MKTDILLLSLVMSLFIIFFNPLIMGCCLFLLSLVLFKSLSSVSGMWYAYLLFMVYIGGMLVLFIYICMMTSNYKFTSTFSLTVIIFDLMITLMILLMNLDWTSNLLMCSSHSMINFPMFMMYILIFFLLVVFFAIIHIIFKKNISMKNDY
uniref:NADH dehydrogenase subunit 6 n=1 Tax=Oxyloma wujiaquensis TaxID=2487312 RepID=UPI001D1115AB|nr:NADH dehydrogenase subunit 6 [Oxyloma wujiaquensis]QZO77382.1 NADH dehydrogenase subunit 6 [Oxyloma wujiaquensis]